jgi:signal transduction histidine kinase
MPEGRRVTDSWRTVGGSIATPERTYRQPRSSWKALRDSERRFRALVKASSEILYRMSPDWSEMRQLAGGGFISDMPTPSRGWEWLEKYIPRNEQPRCLQAIHDAIRTKSIFELEHRVRRADGTLGWTHSRAVPILDDNGEITEWFGAASDITARKQAEEALAEAKKEAERANLAKSRLLTAASHDLRQPLQSMALVTNALVARLKDHPASAIVDRLMEAQKAFEHLVDNLLDLSKLNAGRVTPEFRPVSSSEIVNGLAADYQIRASEKGLKFKSSVCEAELLTDPILLIRILSNLLDNAIKYTPAGGIRLSCSRASEKVRFDVVDTGLGIAPEHKEAIFLEFVQLGDVSGEQKQGLGIGLATVKTLCDLLGCETRLWSRPGTGSRFSVFVPVSFPPPRE